MKLPIVIIAIAVIAIEACGVVVGISYGRLHPTTRIDLPEKYQLIRYSDHLRGNYDSTSNTLVIEFDNPKNK